jgi:hypothetical protein
MQALIKDKQEKQDLLYLAHPPPRHPTALAYCTVSFGTDCEGFILRLIMPLFMKKKKNILIRIYLNGKSLLYNLCVQMKKKCFFKAITITKQTVNKISSCRRSHTESIQLTGFSVT